jgi:DNA-binding CsgD family transcriptional regulator
MLSTSSIQSIIDDPIFSERYRKLHGTSGYSPRSVISARPGPTPGAPSLASAVHAALPKLTNVDAALPSLTNVDESLQNVRSVPPLVDQTLPKLTKIDRSSPHSRNDETNPIRKTAPRPLTPRQLAAARLLAAGRSVADVADELRVSRQSLWNWRKHPAFTPAVISVHRDFCRALQPQQPH